MNNFDEPRDAHAVRAATLNRAASLIDASPAKLRRYAVRRVLPRADNYRPLLASAAVDSGACAAMCELMRLTGDSCVPMRVEQRTRHNEQLRQAVGALLEIFTQAAIAMAAAGDDIDAEPADGRPGTHDPISRPTEKP